MKKVLIVAYYFPPMGMGGTQRVAKFVKYLPENGWQPFVLTVKRASYFSEDPTLLEEVASARVYRTGSLDPQRLGALLGASNKKGVGESSSMVSGFAARLNKLLQWVFVPDTKVLWLPFALVRAYRIIRRERVDCLLTSSPPHSIHLGGRLLAAWTGVPWVVDFRDAWAGGNFQKEPTRFHRWLNRSLERAVVKSASHLVTVSDGLRRQFIDRLAVREQAVDVITNGFDRDDFDHQVVVRQPNGSLTICYCGTVSGITPLGNFVNALKHLFDKETELKGRISLKIAGMVLDRSLHKEVLRLDLADTVHFTGYLPHRLAIAEMLAADLLLYPVADWASDDFVPGKTFEYLASGKPVLAMGPRVEGIRILEEAADTTVLPLTAEHEIAAFLRDAALKTQRSSVGRWSGKELEKYERETLTHRLAEIMNDLTR